jgi:hypothetical protein
LFVLTACNQNGRKNDQQVKADTTYAAILEKQKQLPKRRSFNDISEVVADSAYSTWVDRKDSSFSLALHFDEKDTLWLSYSPECLLVFPYTKDTNKLIVFWDNNIDTKYNFDIVKAINKVDKKLIGRPFMVLELENDTTLKATYLEKDLIRKINSSSKERRFFPNKFTLVKEGEMYD